jgi:hypothetical protein
MILPFIKIAFALIFYIPQLLLACLPHEIYIKSHQVNSYERSDGTKVQEYARLGHCRELPRSNYFKDSTSQKFKNINPKIKSWNGTEKNLVLKVMAKLPKWLAAYRIKEILRADSDGTKNPAASIPSSKTLIIYDSFFTSIDQKSIITHELAHIALWDLDATQVEDFSRLSGWEVKKDLNLRIPPKKLLLPDSLESISEDFANHVELYYSSPNHIKTHNSEVFNFIDKLIKQKEKP